MRRCIALLVLACSPPAPTTATVVPAASTALVTAPVPPPTEEQVSARHIVIRVGTFPNGTHHTLEEARRIVMQLRARYEAGEDFAALATQYSEDPGTARRGGDLGTFGRGQMVRDFDDAVFAMAPSTVAIVETVYGVHLVLRTK